MKFGYRKPSIKKSIKARTTGKIKRKVKKAINPMYGQKGMGFVKNPQKSIKDSIYHKTTYDITEPLKNNSAPLKNKKGFLSKLFNWGNSTPVDIMLDENTYVTVHNKKEAKFYAMGMLKIANDCANIVNTTKKPKIFFERYNLLIEKMEQLSKLEAFRCFNGKLPSKNLQEILDKKLLTIDEFIDRHHQDVLDEIHALKTSKAKEKRIETFYENFQIYKNCMEPKNIEKYESLYNELLLDK